MNAKHHEPQELAPTTGSRLALSYGHSRCLVRG